MSAIAGGSGGGGGADVGSKRRAAGGVGGTTKDCSLEGVLATCINSYARDDEDDTLNAALYAVEGTDVVPSYSKSRSRDPPDELTLQMTFTRHILELPGRIRVGGGVGLDDMHKKAQRHKHWRAGTQWELTELIEARVSDCAGPFFLVLWRGMTYTPPDTFRAGPREDVSSTQFIEGELEGEPVALVLKVGGARPAYPDLKDNDEEYEAFLAKWTTTTAPKIAAKVRALMGQARP